MKAEPFPKTRKPAYKIWIDFGSEIGTKQTSAQVTVNYTVEELVGKSVIGCVNLDTKNIAGFTSEFLLVGFENASGAISLARPNASVPSGKKLY